MRPGGGPNPIPRRPTGSARRVCHCRVSRLVTWRSSTPSGDNGRPQALTTTATHHLPPATNALQPEAGPRLFLYFPRKPPPSFLTQAFAPKLSVEMSAVYNADYSCTSEPQRPKSLSQLPTYLSVSGPVINERICFHKHSHTSVPSLVYKTV